jgi:predicted dehydrogenase
MRAVKVALLGACGWMGKCHSLGYRNAALLFPEKNVSPEIIWLVDEAERKLSELQPIYSGARISTNWREPIADPEVDLVDICLPDHLHHEAAKAALLAGKHVYCEKPFTSTAAEAAELAAIAAERGLVTRVGHNFPKNPVHDLAKDIIDRGEIGDIVLFRASMHVDVLADPGTPFMWRCDGKLAPTGVVGDVASHIFSFIHRLIGPVAELVAETAITTKMRPYTEGFGYGAQPKVATSGEIREVTNPDLVTLLCTFAKGGRGVIDVSRVASGRRFLQNYEIYGTKGGLEFRFDEINRLRFFSSDDPPTRQGYRAIDVGPENPNYAAFLPVANFGLGYNEFKAIEVAEVVEAVATGKPAWPTFTDGHEIMKIVDACFSSSRERRWVSI